MVRSRLARCFAALAFLGGVALARPASACWDGYAAGGRGVDVSLWRAASWSPTTARNLAVWVTRLEAVVPADTTITIMNDNLTCDGAGCPDAEKAWATVKPGDYASAFDATAKMFAVSPAARAHAASRGASVYTVQVYAGASPGALATRDRIHALRDDNDLSLAGFYSEGGFPAIHPVAHVLKEESGGAVTYRVVVGAHRTLADAQAVAAELSALGTVAFARPMPAGSTFDEPVSDVGGE